MNNKAEYEKTRASSHYAESEEDGFTWLMPIGGHLYARNGAERPTYIKCQTCGAVLRYSSTYRFGDWAVQHLPGHLTGRAVEVVGFEGNREDEDVVEQGGLE
jgi:hypothetical protein